MTKQSYNTLAKFFLFAFALMMLSACGGGGGGGGGGDTTKSAPCTVTQDRNGGFIGVTGTLPANGSTQGCEIVTSDSGGRPATCNNNTHFCNSFERIARADCDSNTHDCVSGIRTCDPDFQFCDTTRAFRDDCDINSHNCETGVALDCNNNDYFCDTSDQIFSR